MTEHGYPEHIIRIIKFMYEGTAISIDKGKNISQKMEMRSKTGLPFVTHTINIYMDAASSEWQMQLKSHFSVRTMVLHTLLSADCHVIFAKLEDELQMSTLQLSNINHISTSYFVWV
jgi:hypothetical protein